ncbi:hypothetical protein AAIB41_03575 [Brucella sp. BE17]|uniref:hypothetical protein n=1 Tax=Brucella sp. BE17 TaxID=3142977 RepID=UPI0031BB256A
MRTYSETIFHIEAPEINSRLSEMGLTREGLVRTVHAAVVERNNATDLHPSNAAGTFSYHHGVAAIRREFLGDLWKIDRQDGIESIKNDDLQIKISFSNVDEACGFNYPKPRSEKGAGAERAGGAMLFDDLKSFAPIAKGGFSLFYLMVDDCGRAELTRPVIEKKTFTAAIERIFLIREVVDIELLMHLDANDVADGFEPEIVRK